MKNLNEKFLKQLKRFLVLLWVAVATFYLIATWPFERDWRMYIVVSLWVISMSGLFYFIGIRLIKLAEKIYR